MSSSVKFSGPEAFYKVDCCPTNEESMGPLKNPVFVTSYRRRGEKVRYFLEQFIFYISGSALCYTLIAYLFRKYLSCVLKTIPIKLTIFVILPAFLYSLIAQMVKCILHPASSCLYMSRPLNSYIFTQLHKRYKIKAKYIAIKVNGYLIDGLILGREQDFETQKRRVVLVSLGNAESYEATFSAFYDFAYDVHLYVEMAQAANSILLMYNYPGVRRSQGALFCPKICGDVHRAFLEFAIKYLEGKEIVDFGRSIGGGVSAEGRLSFPLAEGVNYLPVKDRTFSNLTDCISHKVGHFLGWLAAGFGWRGYASDEQISREPLRPAIVIQTGDTKKMKPYSRDDELDPGVVMGDKRLISTHHPWYPPLQRMRDRDQLADTDNIISKEASLAAHVPNQDPIQIYITPYNHQQVSQEYGISIGKIIALHFDSVKKKKDLQIDSVNKPQG